MGSSENFSSLLWGWMVRGNWITAQQIRSPWDHPSTKTVIGKKAEAKYVSPNISSLSCVCVCVCSIIQLCLTLCDPMGRSPPGSSCRWSFSSKNTRVGWHLPPPGDLLHPGIKPTSPVSLALSSEFLSTSVTWEDPSLNCTFLNAGMRRTLSISST